MRIAGVPEGGVESPGFSLQSGQVWECCPASDPTETRGAKACSLAEVFTRVWPQVTAVHSPGGKDVRRVGRWAKTLKSCYMRRLGVLLEEEMETDFHRRTNTRKGSKLQSRERKRQ